MNCAVNKIKEYNFPNNRTCIRFIVFEQIFNAYEDGIPFSSVDFHGKLLYENSNEITSKTFFGHDVDSLIDAMKKWCMSQNITEVCPSEIL